MKCGFRNNVGRFAPNSNTAIQCVEWCWTDVLGVSMGGFPSFSFIFRFISLLNSLRKQIWIKNCLEQTVWTKMFIHVSLLHIQDIHRLYKTHCAMITSFSKSIIWKVYTFIICCDYHHMLMSWDNLMMKIRRPGSGRTIILKSTRYLPRVRVYSISMNNTRRREVCAT